MFGALKKNALNVSVPTRGLLIPNNEIAVTKKVTKSTVSVPTRGLLIPNSIMCRFVRPKDTEFPSPQGVS